jgi:hypothetical protein
MEIAPGYAHRAIHCRLMQKTITQWGKTGDRVPLSGSNRRRALPPCGAISDCSEGLNSPLIRDRHSRQEGVTQRSASEQHERLGRNRSKLNRLRFSSGDVCLPEISSTFPNRVRARGISFAVGKLPAFAQPAPPRREACRNFAGNSLPS